MAQGRSPRRLLHQQARRRDALADLCGSLGLGLEIRLKSGQLGLNGAEIGELRLQVLLELLQSDGGCDAKCLDRIHITPALDCRMDRCHLLRCGASGLAVGLDRLSVGPRRLQVGDRLLIECNDSRPGGLVDLL